MSHARMTQRSFRHINQVKLWAILPAVAGVAILVALMSIDNIFSAFMIFLGLIFSGWMVGYCLAGRCQRR